jgi:DNA-binding GntR family transcriptional regulator
MPVPNFASPQRVLLRDQVRDQIRTAILDGTFQPGERLMDEELIDWLGVSRTPIREALGALALEGLIELAPNRWTRVAKATPVQAEQSVRALGVIIGGIARATVPHLTDTDRRSIAARHDDHLAAVRDGGTAAIVPRITAGHQDWLDRCPNPVLADIGRRALHGLAFTFRIDGIDTLVPADALIQRITELRDAVLAADPAAAGAAIEAAHLVGSPLTAPDSDLAPNG